MATVTGIVASPRREGRYDLLLDGRDAGRVSLEIIERFALRVGVAVAETQREALDEAMAVLAVYDRALNMLAAQSRSRVDLRRRLVQKGEPAAHVDSALDRLAAAGLLNDAAFARQFTRSRVLGRGASKRRVRDELYRKGVAGATADEAIADVFDDVFDDEAVDEAALVEQAARKKLRTLGKVDAPTRRRRLYEFLARRGYDGALIRETMGRVLVEREGDADELVEESV